MPLIIKIAIPVLIVAITATGGLIIWKLSTPAEIPISTAPFVAIKANNAENSIIVPFETPITLSWESQNVNNCLVSGDWYSPVSASGSQAVGKATKPINYTLTCADSGGKEISSSVAVKIEESTIPNKTLASISLGDLFKDFHYLWKKEFCREAKNDPDVIALQTALFFEGLLSPQEKITGNYDDDTFQAVKKFQENYGITPQTGCVGKNTMAKLNDIFYYYKYSNQVAYQESSQGQVSQTQGKISSYQKQIAQAAVSAPAPTEQPTTTVIPEQPTAVSAPIPTTTATTTAPTTTLAQKLPYIASFKVDGKSSAQVEKGASVKLTWESKNTSSCAASGAWTGSKPVANSAGESIVINNYSSFKLTCSGENNKFVSSSVFVRIPAASSDSSITKKDNRPKITKVVSANCAMPASGAGPTGGQSPCEIKIEGENFDPFSNTIIFECDQGCFDTKVVGKWWKSSNGSIDVDPNTSGSNSSNTNTITFWIYTNWSLPSQANVSIKVHTSSGGTSDSVNTTIRPNRLIIY